MPRIGTEKSCHAGGGTERSTPMRRTEGRLNLPRAAKRLTGLKLDRRQLRQHACPRGLRRGPAKNTARLRGLNESIQSQNKAQHASRDFAGFVREKPSFFVAEPLPRVLRRSADENRGGYRCSGVRTVHRIQDTSGLECKISDCSKAH